jgi:cytochrome P450
MVTVGIRLELPFLWHILYRLPIPAIQFFMHGNDRVIQAGSRAVQNTKNAATGKGQTIFSMMYPEDDAPLFPDSLMAEEAANLIIAGSDTTAVALTYLIYSVLANPDVKKKLLQELAGAQLTWDKLEDLEYLNNVIQETLRLYPSVPGSLPRTCPEGGAVFAGFRIPQKVTVSTQAYTFHREPLVFKKPDK